MCFLIEFKNYLNSFNFLYIFIYFRYSSIQHLMLHILVQRYIYSKGGGGGGGGGGG